MNALAAPQQRPHGAGAGNWPDQAMSWVVSLTFHLCVIVLLLLVGIVVTKPARPAEAQPSGPPAFWVGENGGTLRPAGPSKPLRVGVPEGTDDELKLSGLFKMPGLPGPTWQTPREMEKMENNDMIAVAGPDSDNTVSLPGPLGLGNRRIDGPDNETKLPRGIPTDTLTPRPPGPPEGGGDLRVVYLLDASGSMVDNLDAIKARLVRELGWLSFDEKTGRGCCFNVVFFRTQAEAYSPAPLPATNPNKIGVLKWLKGIHAANQTDPVPALRMAFKWHPDQIVVLSDGEFDEQVLDVVAALQQSLARPARIITIAYGDFSSRNLEKLAKDYSGYHIRIPKEN